MESNRFSPCSWAIPAQTWAFCEATTWIKAVRCHWRGTGTVGFQQHKLLTPPGDKPMWLPESTWDKMYLTCDDKPEPSNEDSSAFHPQLKLSHVSFGGTKEDWRKKAWKDRHVCHLGESKVGHILNFYTKFIILSAGFPRTSHLIIPFFSFPNFKVEKSTHWIDQHDAYWMLTKI